MVSLAGDDEVYGIFGKRRLLIDVTAGLSTFVMDTEQLKNEFWKRFDCNGKYIVRCPGRVNLIGEHIDYSGYGVLPMAINASTYIVASERDTDEIAFQNTDSAFKAYTYKFGENWIGSVKPEWYHYFLCGWRGVLERLNLPPKGMNILLSVEIERRQVAGGLFDEPILNPNISVPRCRYANTEIHPLQTKVHFRSYRITGNIPPSAGLSSSSSIVCAAALMTLALYTGKTFDIIDKVEFAEMCAKVERYVGMEGGGMDQAIEVLAAEGSAMRIDFEPLRFSLVTLPKNALFAVIHSGETLNKAATSQYNERVVECRLAAQIIAKVSEIKEWRKIRTLGGLAERLQKTAQEMVVVVDEVLQAPLYTRDNALSLLGITDQEFNKTVLSANTQHMETFKLAQRARHVYAEADRVSLFHEACKNGDIKEMGKLMNDSHASCKDLYECSCDKLDEVVEKCLQKGALGARLTGAGWGGCAVAVFDKKQPDLEVLFWSLPAGGIELIKC